MSRRTHPATDAATGGESGREQSGFRSRYFVTTITCCEVTLALCSKSHTSIRILPRSRLAAWRTNLRKGTPLFPLLLFFFLHRIDKQTVQLIALKKTSNSVNARLKCTAVARSTLASSQILRVAVKKWM